MPLQQQLLLFPQPFPGSDKHLDVRGLLSAGAAVFHIVHLNTCNTAGVKTSGAGSALSLNSKCCASTQDISYKWYIFLLEMKIPSGNGSFNNAFKKSKLIN